MGGLLGAALTPGAADAASWPRIPAWLREARGGRSPPLGAPSPGIAGRPAPTSPHVDALRLPALWAWQGDRNALPSRVARHGKGPTQPTTPARAGANSPGRCRPGLMGPDGEGCRCMPASWRIRKEVFQQPCANSGRQMALMMTVKRSLPALRVPEHGKPKALSEMDLSTRKRVLSPVPLAAGTQPCPGALLGLLWVPGWVPRPHGLCSMQLGQASSAMARSPAVARPEP